MKCRCYCSCNSHQLFIHFLDRKFGTNFHATNIQISCAVVVLCIVIYGDFSAALIASIWSWCSTIAHVVRHTFKGTFLKRCKNQVNQALEMHDFCRIPSVIIPLHVTGQPLRLAVLPSLALECFAGTSSRAMHCYTPILCKNAVFLI